MEVHLTPELEVKLNRIAVEQGRDASLVAAEAIERLADHEGWFMDAVERGLSEAGRGELLDHFEVVTRIEKRLLNQQSSS
ncbi:MAG: hypothetical protein JJE04_18955 [Acidobacteriia bacterium]|nr:hypothetical protein [Terriglobia bacterium]